MILVHRPGGEALFVNADLIEVIEPGPPAVLVLVDARRITVAEAAPEVVDRVTRFRASVLLAADERRTTTPRTLRLAPVPPSG